MNGYTVFVQYYSMIGKMPTWLTLLLPILRAWGTRSFGLTPTYTASYDTHFVKWGYLACSSSIIYCFTFIERGLLLHFFYSTFYSGIIKKTLFFLFSSLLNLNIKCFIKSYTSLASSFTLKMFNVEYFFLKDIY